MAELFTNRKQSLKEVFLIEEALWTVFATWNQFLRRTAVYRLTNGLSSSLVRHVTA